MPKESRRSMNRKSTRQCYEVDDESSASDAWVPSRPSSVTGTKRYSPFQRLPPRRESKSDKEILALREASLSNSKNCGILESGLKYITVLSLHFLQLWAQFGIGAKMLNADIAEKKTTKPHGEALKSDTMRVEKVKKSEVSMICHNCQKRFPADTPDLEKSSNSTADSDYRSKDEETGNSTKTVASKADQNVIRRQASKDNTANKFFGSLPKDNIRISNKGGNRTSKTSYDCLSEEGSMCGSRINENSCTTNKQERTPTKEGSLGKRNKTFPSKSEPRIESKLKNDNSITTDRYYSSNSDGSRTSSSNRYYTQFSDKCRSSQTKQEQSNHSESNREEYSSKTDRKESPKAKNNERIETKDKYNMSSRRSPRKSLKYESDESSDEMVTAAEDSDSSNDRWESANSTILMNTYVEPGNLINEISMIEQSRVEEPMDISIDEQIFGRTYAIFRSPRDLHIQQHSKLSDVNIFSETPVSQASSTSSMDEEIAKIFQRQCTSSDDENSTSSTQCNSGRLNNPNSRQVEERKTHSHVSSKQLSSDKELVANRRSIPYGTDERKKTVKEDEAKEKKNDERQESKHKEKCESSQRTPCKQNVRTPRTPIKSKDAKRREVKYKERGTQTDSAFSDEDVEMIPIDPRSPDKRTCCRSSGRKSRSILYQLEQMDQDLDYVADNEDSNDGSVKSARCRISSESASSSSTSDLGYEERVRITPDHGNRESIWQQVHQAEVSPFHGVQMIRAPPGFPQVPQNTPVRFCNCGQPNCFILAAAIAKDVKQRSTFSPFPQNYTPAPTPMKHLYHEYPEFMTPREDINASKILRNILEKNC